MVTAGVGTLALVTGIGWIAALTGLSSVALASVAVRTPEASAVVQVEVATDEADVDLATVANGILDEATLDTTLRGRIAVARRALRPLSVIHLEVLDVDGGTDALASEDALDEVLAATLRESDVCGLRADGVYVFILEETGEDGAVWTAERLRRKLAMTSGDRRFCAGIASYPSHGLDADVLDAKARAALDAAREWRRDRIEVATAT